MTFTTAVDIRAVAPEGAGLFARVADEVFDAPILPDRLAAYLADPMQAMVVAVADGMVVGQARGAVVRNPDEGDVFYIDNLGVAPDFRRRGIASRLIDALADVARARGCEVMWVGTEPDNLPARGLYRRRGADATMAYYEWRL